MYGIVLLNERDYLDGLSREESWEHQKASTFELASRHNVKVISLNPYQVYNYYTIPHALLYDLQRKKASLDYLLMYSESNVRKFKDSYFAYWILLKSYFNNILTVDSRDWDWSPAPEE